jgi:Glycosyl hydrolases family 16
MGDRILQELPGWSLAWSDEFDGAVGSPVDPASWQPQVGGNGWGNQELQYYTHSSDNARLDGAGNLQIVVRRSDPWLRDTRFGGCAYTSARLVSRDRVSLTYGLVQARIRLPRGRGLWPAFWMLGQNLDQVGWPQCGEIDVMENFGKDPTVVHGTVHGPGYAGGAGVTASYRADASLADDFHLYAVCWEPELVPGRPALQHRDARRPAGQPLGLRPRLLPAPQPGRGRHLLGHPRPVSNIPPGHAGRLHPHIRQRRAAESSAAG